jgi:glutathione synthase
MKVFAGLYNLSAEEDNTCVLKSTIERAMSSPSSFLMKPQREGGGNNIVGADLSRSLQEMSPAELSAYILMDRIQSPSAMSTIVRCGQPSALLCTCELGIYGVYIGYGGEDGEILNDDAGYLLRVKPASSVEGGVAAGFAGLSAPHFSS